MSTVDEVLAAAMALPPSDRAALVNRLFESLDDADELGPELHTDWTSELQMRTSAIAESKAMFVDGMQAVEEIRRSLPRRDSP